jgi:hypothetical protein
MKINGKFFPRYLLELQNNPVDPISDHQQSYGYEGCPWKGSGPPLLMAADF